MKIESSSPNRGEAESKKKLKKSRSIKLSRMSTTNPSGKWAKTRLVQPVDSVSDDASSENPTQIGFSSTPSPTHLKETSDSDSSFERNNSQEEKEPDPWNPNTVSFPYAKPLGNPRKVLSLKSNRPLKKKSSIIAPFPNFAAAYVMPHRDGNESDRASVGSSCGSNEERGTRRGTETQKELKPKSKFGTSRFDHHSSPSSLKATSTSEGKKMHSQASLLDSESSNGGGTSNLKTLKRTPSLRPRRILMNKSSFKSKKPSALKNCSRIPEVSSVDKATCSSALKSERFSQSVEEREHERGSVAKVCPYNYCSLHGHRHSTAAPPLKRVLSKRRRPLKTQKSMRPRRQSSMRGKYPGDIMELLEKSRAVIFIGKEVDSDLSVKIYAAPRMEFFGRSSEGNEDDNVAELVLGEASYSERGFQGNLNGDRDFVTGEPEAPPVTKSTVGNSESNSTTDVVQKSHIHTRNRSSLWRLVHQHIENQLLEGKHEEKQWDEANVDSYRDTSVGNHDQDDQEIEIRKTYATKVAREAIEKILLPEVEDQSSDDRSVTSDFGSEQEILDDNLGEGEKLSISNSTGAMNEGEKMQKKNAPNSWSNLKKLILLKRFVKALEKVRKYDPPKAQQLPLEPSPEAEKNHLKPRMMDRKRSSEEWMLDYALQQAVSELAPTQKRKVELLIRAFETMAPSSDEEQIQLKIEKRPDVPVDGKQDDSARTGQTADGSDKITSSTTGKQESTLTDFCNEDVPESNREKLGVGELTIASKRTTTDDSAKAATENVMTSSACGCGPIKELTEAGEQKNKDSEPDNESIEQFHSVNDTEPDNSSHEAYKTELEKEKHVSMWHLIHQHMVEGLSLEGKSKSLRKDDEEQVGETNTLAATENSHSCPDLSAWEQSTGMECHGTECQEVELRKMFAIKLVREAIEKILLPELQDQSSDDQSVTSEITSDQEVIEKSHSEGGEQNVSTPIDSAREGSMDCDSNNVSFSQQGTSLTTTNISESENEKAASKAQSEKKTPKGWSNLKKLILLKRFVKELEKVRKFNPKKPRLLQLKPSAEAEEVSLRHQKMNERKNAEELMLDYALRKVISELAPKQKRKVALLVKAFETVAPTSGTPQIQVTFREYKDTNPEGCSETERDKCGSELMEAKKEAEDIVTSNLDIGAIQSTMTKEKSNVAKDKDVQEAIHEDRVTTFCSEILKDGSESTSRNTKLDEQLMATEEKKKGYPETDCTTAVDSKTPLDKQKHISMWHLLCQHVVSDIATKVESQLPDGEDEDEQVDSPNPKTRLSKNGSFDNEGSRGQRIVFSQRDAVKLVREAIKEILSPEVNDDSSDSQSVACDIITEQELPETNHGNVEESSIETPIYPPKDGSVYRKTEEKEKENGLAADNIPTLDEEKTVSLEGTKSDQGKPKNWSKLRRLMLLKRSMKALENARKPSLRATQSLPVNLGKEEEKVDLRHQSMAEKKKAEQWMLDYAVQHIVTKLTPARKRRVSMLVEAFEAVVPLPEA
ncbi:hypothetical protein RHMOL_Rhmol03G0032100 [Rhododendron molle]|uniref:Uncharacterized protein n=1 Tax=Rhododendron molle TaxID=49168 RepID=A0ACC0PB61_RHOML|nr:hypothetical protein RHMOL_Rhmol03G0032100 [Rhododendron molle]